MLTEAPLGRMAAEEKMQRLMNYARKEAARWERTFGALSRNALVKATCYMGSEAINKLGMTLALKRRTGGGRRGFLKAWKYLAGVSLAQQVIVMALDMMRDADPAEEDEWFEWAMLNLATGATGLGVLQAIPLLGEAVQEMSGGWVKTGSLGQMVYDFGGAVRSGKKVAKMASDDKDDSAAERMWAGSNLGRHLTFMTGAWRGINSTSKALSELSGALQSVNAAVNVVRPAILGARNTAKKEQKKAKAEEKRKQEERKAEWEAEKEKKKRRSEMLNRG